MAEVKDLVKEATRAPDILFHEGTSIDPVSGPIRRGRVQNPEGLQANEYLEPGAKRQKRMGGREVWRSINTVELTGGRVEGTFLGGCLFQLTPEDVTRDQQEPVSTQYTPKAWWNEK
mgnify:FL=1